MLSAPLLSLFVFPFRAIGARGTPPTQEMRKPRQNHDFGLNLDSASQSGALRSFPVRLRSVIKARGGHISRDWSSFNLFSTSFVEKRLGNARLGENELQSARNGHFKKLDICPLRVWAGSGVAEMICKRGARRPCVVV